MPTLHFDWLHHTVPLWTVLWSMLLVFALISGTVLQIEIEMLKRQVDENTIDVAGKATAEERTALVSQLHKLIADNDRRIELESERLRREIDGLGRRITEQTAETGRRMDLQTVRIDKLLDDLRDELVHDYLLPVEPRHPDDQR